MKIQTPNNCAWALAIAGALCAAGGGVPGCTVYLLAQCEYDLECELGRAGSTSSSGSSSSGGPAPGCIPSMADGPVDDTCGIFVSSSLGDDANAGTTKSAPVKTLKQALTLGAQQNLPIYACAEVFDNAGGESLSIAAGTALFGALDCTGDWRHSATAKSTVQGAPDVVALVLRTGSGITRIEDFVVRAPDATLPGASAIAVLSEPILSAQLTRCELIAGNGKDGAQGITPNDPIGPSDPADPAIRGKNGAQAAAGDLVLGNEGGAGAVNALCPSAIGGKGGTGFVDKGSDGTAGMPAGAFGAPGLGEPAMGAWNCIAIGNGQGGDNGAAGTEGASAKDTELGSLDLNGFVAAAGKPGTDGGPGQSGGGGGAAKGKGPNINGASGGGGGAGGCGGKGGGGGQGGGASIALASLGTAFAFNGVALRAANGGKGGDGSNGQNGALGGSGGLGGAGDSTGSPTSAACDGGKGGTGGLGGKGGAGRGGHSLGIAYTGPAPSLEGLSITLGMPGSGGTAFMSNGAPGLQADSLEFP